MTAPPRDAWVPVPLRWRHVVAGDAFLGKDGGLPWHVVAVEQGRRVIVARGARTVTATVDPDDVIRVLVPVTERDAVALTREQLGARLVERRAS